MHSFSLYEWLYSEKIVQNIPFPPWIPTVEEKKGKSQQKPNQKNLTKVHFISVVCNSMN